MLHARVAEYDPAWCDLLYERREIFEAYNKGLSLVPTREFPWFRVTSRNAAASSPRTPMWPGACSSDPRRGPAVIARLRDERGATTDWFGVPTNTVRAVLEAYAVTGVLGLARRDGNRRYYDVVERLLPADLLARKIPLKEQLRHKLLSRYRATASSVWAADIFGGIGPAKPDPRWPGYPGRTALREELVATGELVPVEVENVRGKRFVLKRRSTCSSARRSRRPPSHSCPRSIRWCGTGACSDPCSIRIRLGALLPPAKRRWVGTCSDALRRPPRRPDRAAHRPRRWPVQVLGVWWEDGFAPRRTEGFVDAMRDALRAYLRFGGATRIEWAPELTMEKRLFLTRP